MTRYEKQLFKFVVKNVLIVEISIFGNNNFLSVMMFIGSEYRKYLVSFKKRSQFKWL